MKKIRVSYSSSQEIKDYIDSVAERYNMTVSGVITMIIQQYRFQEETMQKLESLNVVMEQLSLTEKMKKDDK